ncbi:HTH_XRE domain containing protein [uncultured Caudovirales phage]|uniref:HTH_XRE domain containing protein n=1 Tax=uncultured Caudovirales phage TaxID=2100421 RepID=A0A6J5S1F3_9CAUD|nr:HTH_XRE domain containing protein [uncultured Caudovirales phage]
MGAWLGHRLRTVGKRPIDLARHLGIAPTRIYETLKGKRQIQPKEIARAAAFLEITETQLATAMETGEIPATTGPSPRDATTRPKTLTVKRAMLAGSGWQMFDQTAGEVPRPEFLEFSADAFALIVQDENNSPVYHTRDTILVDPGAPVTVGDDCIFSESVSDGSTGVFLACLRRSTPTEWVVCQHGSKSEKKLSKKAYPTASVVIGRYMAR